MNQPQGAMDLRKMFQQGKEPKTVH